MSASQVLNAPTC